MTAVDIGEIIFIAAVVIVGIGGMLWVVTQEKKED